MIASVPDEGVGDGDDGECPRCGESARIPAIPDPDRPPPPFPPVPVVPRSFVPPVDECGLEEGGGGDLVVLGERKPCWSRGC